MALIGRKPRKVFYRILQNFSSSTFTVSKSFTSQREYRVTETYCYQNLAFSFSSIAINFNYEKPKKKNF